MKRIVLSLVILLLGGGSTVVAPEPSPGRVPPRQSLVSEAQSWQDARKAAPDGSASFVVGLKAPGARRGVWRDAVLVPPGERRLAESRVLGIPGVRLVSREDGLPAMSVRLRDRSALRAVRRSPFVDYVDPLYVPVESAGIGCTSPTLDTSGSIVDPVSGDIFPWSFPLHRIAEAWRRIPAGPGAGITVGIVDTGVERDQSQLTMPGFAAGLSTGRTSLNLGANGWDGGDTPWGTCNHGTRVAGLVAAPRDGVNVVGVAWKANIVTVNATDSVVIGSGNAQEISRGIGMAVNHGARIITMAFGNHLVSGEMHLIEDRIRSIYYGNYGQGVLFVGAAGTLVCPFGAVAWPAYLPEVVAVAGVARDGRSPVYGESCYGDAVDIAAIVDSGNVETTGMVPDQVVGLGASSGATATISGIAALIWSRYPSWTRDQVRERLFASAQGYRDPEIGWGVPNAYRAVGGLADLGIRHPAGYEPGEPYALTADTHLAEGPLNYSWSTGATTSSITRLPPARAKAQTTTLTVTDTSDGTSLTVSVTIKPLRDGPPPCGIGCPH
jgi:serine protease